jgi:15-cis-phytoene synthase
MTLQIQSWENTLLARAQEVLHNHHHTALPVSTDQQALANAYETCSQMTRFHSKTFYIASGLLPYEKRQAARALYAFCRVTDDIVDSDESAEVRQAQLKAWREIVMSPTPKIDNPVAIAWLDARCRFNIPSGYAEQLIDGVARDLTQTRYETFADLAEYSYGVASTVGLMAMHITGFQSNEALPYAVRLGVALQLTNILRDVGEDWALDRFYLPLDELHEFGLSEADLAKGEATEKWQTFINFQIDRTQQLYHEAWPGIQMLNRDGRFAIAAAADLYRAVLGDIQRHNCDVFSRRAHLSRWGKLSRLPGIWLHAQQT